MNSRHKDYDLSWSAAKVLLEVKVFSAALVVRYLAAWVLPLPSPRAKSGASQTAKFYCKIQVKHGRQGNLPQTGLL